MSLFQVQRIASEEYCSALSKLSSKIAAKAYQQFSNDTVLHRWLETSTSVATWQGRIRQPHSAVYGAFFESSLVGSVWVAERPGIHNTDAYIGGLYVAAPRKGIATNLLDHAELRAAAWGCQSILVEVASKSGAKSLFQKRGYDHLGSHPGRNFRDVSWAEMRKLLVQSTKP